MKSVLISIKPKWCDLIASGRKTLEIRKTRPKLSTPFKCYIYCTKAKDYFSIGNGVYACIDELYRLPTGEIKFGDSFELAANWVDEYSADNFLNGKVIGEFVCDYITQLFNVCTDKWDYLNGMAHDNEKMIVSMANLTEIELHNYANGKNCYAWHISDLKIYDNPKELSDFAVTDMKHVQRCGARERVFNNPDFTNGVYLRGAYYCNKYNDFCDKCRTKKLDRPPQSWCYVENLEVV